MILNYVICLKVLSGTHCATLDLININYSILQLSKTGWILPEVGIRNVNVVNNLWGTRMGHVLKSDRQII